MRHLHAALSLLVAVPALGLFTAAGCAPDVPEDEIDGNEPADQNDSAISDGTVEQALSSGCSTAAIKPLSQQIVDEMRCMDPNDFVEVPARPNLVTTDAVFPYLIKPARDRLVAALDANPSKTMTTASMFRTVGQQYLLRRWYEQGKCGITAAAQPGASNHETGLAIDISEYSSWKSPLESRGFDWFGNSDKPHYDYEGSGATSFKGRDVKAFQRLWNRNHSSDKIGEDGVWGNQTKSRLQQSPAHGFAIGAVCNTPQDPPDDPPPTDAEAWSCDGSTGHTKIDGTKYYATSFGCAVMANGSQKSDSGDNCIPACLSWLKQNGVCTSGSTGPSCERAINWYAADRDRFGCGARLKLTDPESGRSAVVMVIDAGPACWVEQQGADRRRRPLLPRHRVSLWDLGRRLGSSGAGRRRSLVRHRDRSGRLIIEADPSRKRQCPRRRCEHDLGQRRSISRRAAVPESARSFCGKRADVSSVGGRHPEATNAAARSSSPRSNQVP